MTPTALKLTTTVSASAIAGYSGFAGAAFLVPSQGTIIPFVSSLRSMSIAVIAKNPHPQV